MNIPMNKGIILEQNKEPMLSKGIKHLKAFPIKELRFRPNEKDPSTLTVEEILEIIKEANIVDESDGLKLFDKIAKAYKNKTHIVIVDAVDDEPYISSQLCMTIFKKEELEVGIDLICKVLNTEKAHIEVYKNIFDLDVTIPTKIGKYKIKRIGGRYPVEHREFHSKQRFSTLTIGACALIFLERAARYGLKQTSTFISIAGDSVANPANYEIPLKTTISDILEAVGIIHEPKRLICGGSMTGSSVANPAKTAVTYTTRGVIAFAESFKDFGLNCIGCGRCVEVCPSNLSPFYLYRFIRAKREKEVKSQTSLCIGCGTCSYICPAKLDLSYMIYVSGHKKEKGDK